MSEKQNNISHVLPTYSRMNVKFERGSGAHLYDENGDDYVDFGSGIAVNLLGHCHPKMVKALKDQSEKLWHTSNLYIMSGQENLSDRLSKLTFADKMFFTNSGAESVECAIKMARRYHYCTGNVNKNRIITFEGSFHGRTLATIAAAGSAKMLEGFGPDLDGFDNVPFYDDMADVEKHITDNTAAIMIEPVQGEGGIRNVSDENLKTLRKLADDNGLLLIFDEVQCGVGRTGKLFAYEHAGVTPDIMAIAKGIGGGFPLGACLAIEDVACHMTKGTHGSTYGGNPLATAMGSAVLDIIEEEKILDNVNEMSAYLCDHLETLRRRYPDIIDLVRGLGLMIGVKLKIEPPVLVSAALENKLLLVGASDNTVRMLPPLNVTKKDIDLAIERLEKSIKQIQNS
ncbi:aspartate aminotransferase family protein [Pseudemcibacter aquimaris]|uniref:aspartate aminotransferase family protein n=1 Tax=Pseudemcibacter aquimaris TaxID=2857064 RepID=UPI0020135966|nr:aspartate aminotransferase family protein [Pseudemcibacter aquimaris]MCC3860248.1 aspartate aminotransferase family protein [Pseudemcibacter aquimaris]WDU57573.1 aspartate aminotransferase family protein [Pseudemcibacter aquimaris]